MIFGQIKNMPHEKQFPFFTYLNQIIWYLSDEKELKLGCGKEGCIFLSMLSTWEQAEVTQWSDVYFQITQSLISEHQLICGYTYERVFTL